MFTVGVAMLGYFQAGILISIDWIVEPRGQASRLT